MKRLNIFKEITEKENSIENEFCPVSPKTLAAALP